MPLPQYNTRGGFLAYTVFSGTAGGAAAITSGQGRVHSIIPHQGLVSGQTVVMYDSAVAVSGGPIAASGHNVLGGIPPGPPTGLSGTFIPPLLPLVVEAPFNSGLCVTDRSGSAGYTILYTLETGRYKQV